MSLRNQLMRLSTGGLIESEAGHVSLVTALKDVSLELKSGDRIGLIGSNGAGKSTLLRTMAGIYTPTHGRVIREGRLATVFEVGSGMESELSGYENIVRMGMLMGMSQDNARGCIPDVETFTELGDFLQLPVRTYSTGMSMRLMFAVATAIQPQILLVDEMFGTGDAAFQERARIRMQALISSAEIFVFASHSLDLIHNFCNRVFRMEHGALTEVDMDTLVPHD
jgi:ABC-type polysaccharide/polyol phosphate transport system ATPase subunit